MNRLNSPAAIAAPFLLVSLLLHWSAWSVAFNPDDLKQLLPGAIANPTSPPLMKGGVERTNPLREGGLRGDLLLSPWKPQLLAHWEAPLDQLLAQLPGDLVPPANSNYPIQLELWRAGQRLQLQLSAADEAGESTLTPSAPWRWQPALANWQLAWEQQTALPAATVEALQPLLSQRTQERSPAQLPLLQLSSAPWRWWALSDSHHLWQVIEPAQRDRLLRWAMAVHPAWAGHQSGSDLSALANQWRTSDRRLVRWVENALGEPAASWRELPDRTTLVGTWPPGALAALEVANEVSPNEPPRCRPYGVAQYRPGTTIQRYYLGQTPVRLSGWATNQGTIWTICTSH